MKHKTILRALYGLGIAWMAASFSIESTPLRMALAFVGGIAIGVGSAGWED